MHIPLHCRKIDSLACIRGVRSVRPCSCGDNSEIHLVAEHIRGNWSRFAFDGANTCTPHSPPTSRQICFISLSLQYKLGIYTVRFSLACQNEGCYLWTIRDGAEDHTRIRMRACEFLTLTLRPNKGLQTMSNEPSGIGAADAHMCASAAPFPILGGTGTLICIRHRHAGSKRCVDGRINCAIIFGECFMHKSNFARGKGDR
jgi:hypothetical protein